MVRSVRSSAGQARRNHLPRTVGLGLGFFCVAAVFQERGADPLTWAALAFHGFAWPPLALWLALRSRDPGRTETRNLLVDSGLGGAWIVLMGFSLLPSALVLAMLSMNNIGVAGFPLFLRGLGTMALGGLVTGLLAGFHLDPTVSMFVLLACMPLLLIHPLMIGMVTYSIAQRLVQQRRAFERLSRMDSLSGLYNRLHWDERVAAELARLQRHGGEATLLLIDIDHFKQYNDTWGHAGGDEAIRYVARVLRQESRIEDGIARYGGEEFGMLLPGIGRGQALAAAERLRALVEQGSSEGPAEVTVSIGVAPFDHGLVDAEEWILRADTALYAAKDAGRNRCVIAEPSAEPAQRFASTAA